jgi:hypothetical protein
MRNPLNVDWTGQISKVSRRARRHGGSGRIDSSNEEVPLLLTGMIGGLVLGFLAFVVWWASDGNLWAPAIVVALMYD